MSLLYHDESLLTTGEAARAVRVSRPTIVKWCNEGLLPCRMNPSGHRRIRYADILAITSPPEKGNEE